MTSSLNRSWTVEAFIYPTMLDTNITEYYICVFWHPANFANQGFAIGIYRRPTDNSYLPVVYSEGSMGNTGGSTSE